MCLVARFWIDLHWRRYYLLKRLMCLGDSHEPNGLAPRTHSTQADQLVHCSFLQISVPFFLQNSFLCLCLETMGFLSHREHFHLVL